MRSKKSIIFLVAIFMPAVFAIKQSYSNNTTNDRAFATIFVQYDCLNGTEDTPSLLTNWQGDLNLLSQTDAIMMCSNGTQVICSAEYEITLPGGTEKPLKFINGKLQFNPYFPGGASGAAAYRVLDILYCDVPK